MLEEMALFTPLTAGGMALSCATMYICRGGKIALLRIVVAMSVEDLASYQVMIRCGEDIAKNTG